jgi:hypothetical protein
MNSGMKIGLPDPMILSDRGTELSPSYVLRALSGQVPPVTLAEQIPAVVLRSAEGGAVLSLKGTSVLAEGLSGLAAGQTVQVKVVALGPRPQIILVSTPSSASARSGANLGNIQVGQVVVGTVLAQAEQGVLLLELGGASVEATAPELFAVGSKLILQAEQLHPQAVFQIVDHEPALEPQAVQLILSQLQETHAEGSASSSLQQLLTELRNLSPQEASPALAKLQVLLERDLAVPSQPGAEQIAALVRDGGLQYEAKLAMAIEQGPQGLSRVAANDLKGAVLRALQELQQSPSRSVAANWQQLPSSPVAGAAHPQAANLQGLASTLGGFLHQIEGQQALNLLAKVHGTAYQLQIPFQTDSSPTTVLLAVHPDSKGTGSRSDTKTGHNLLFQLSLEPWGLTRIDAHVAFKTLRAVFYVERSQEVDRLAAQLPAFRERLQELGFTTVLLEVRPLDQLTPQQQQQFKVLESNVPETVHLVDVRA